MKMYGQEQKDGLGQLHSIKVGYILAELNQDRQRYGDLRLDYFLILKRLKV